MALENEIKNVANEILNEFGSNATLYLNPTASYDDEGFATYNIGTGTNVKILAFLPSGKLITPEMEGIDEIERFRVFLSADNNISENTIIEFNNIYYKIVSIHSNPLGSLDSTFYELTIEKIQPQSAVGSNPSDPF